MLCSFNPKLKDAAFNQKLAFGTSYVLINDAYPSIHAEHNALSKYMARKVKPRKVDLLVIRLSKRVNLEVHVHVKIV